MSELITGLLGVITFALFVGGLGHSIWDNTGSIAFPVIVLLVVIMAVAGLVDELRTRGKSKGGS